MVTIFFSKRKTDLEYKDNGLWVFGEWFGNRCCDNSFYFANYIAKNHPEIKCAWIAKPVASLSQLDKSITVYEMNSPEADDIIKNAHVLLMNQGYVDFSDRLLIPGGPFSVNFWHGVPWKRIGLDGLKTGRIRLLYYKLQNRLLAADCYLSLSKKMTRVLCSSCGAKKSRIIESGYPRNVLFYDSNEISLCRSRLLEYMQTKYPASVCSSDVKVITYMPTFRDKADSQFNFLEMADRDALESLLESNNAILIQKAHFAAKDQGGRECSHLIFCENDYPAQELLAASDMLITDYSSCFFDYLLLDRPIIHYLYDYDYYANKDRGLYYTKEDVVCGSTPETEEELIRAIKNNLEDPDSYHELRMMRKEKYMTYESPDSCEIITQRIFEELRKRGLEIS